MSVCTCAVSVVLYLYKVRHDDEGEEELPKLDLSSKVEPSTKSSRNAKERSPTKSMTSTSSYVHIPGFLGMVINTYRESDSFSWYFSDISCDLLYH